MRNFEKDFDRLLNNLKEASEILAECNVEMRKALSGTKSIRYVIRHKETQWFYDMDLEMWFSSIECATIFRHKTHAQSIIEDVIVDANKDEVEIVPVSIKVVEHGN